MNSNLVASRPAGSAVLRKITQPLFDTNILDNGVAPNILQWFVIPIGQAMPVTAVNKTEADTNLNQQSQVGMPNMFDLTGFNFELFMADPTDVNDNVEDLFQLYEQSVFRFIFSQNRKWLELPLSQIPQGVSLTGQLADSDVTGNTESMFVHQGMASVSEVYNFTVRKSPIRIHSAEGFKCEVEWTNGGTAAWQWANTRVRVFLQGSFYTAL